MRCLLILMVAGAFSFGCSTTAKMKSFDSATTLNELSLASGGSVYYRNGSTQTFEKYGLRTSDSGLLSVRDSGTNEWTVIPDSDVREVRFAISEKQHLLGAFLGGVVGTGVGLAVGKATMPEESCGEGMCFNVGAAYHVLAVAGAGLSLGAVVGALVIPSQTTIYRFRPDTSQEMKVVVSLSPGYIQR